jgi:dTDP-4-dehydrorhamnose reductase
VALVCHEAGLPLVYISSAGVFDGEKDEPYTEFDIPNPINIYGASKYEGECIIRDLVSEHYIVRAGWMLGGGPAKDHKFVHHVTEQIANGVKVIHGVADKFGTPTYSTDFARCLESLIHTGNFGTYHMASPGSCSRYDVALAIVELLGRDDIEVRKASSVFFSETFYAPRPRSEAMRNYVLDLEGKNRMRPWREALAEYLTEWGTSLCH